MSVESVGGRYDGQGNGSKGEIKREGEIGGKIKLRVEDTAETFEL